MTGSQIEEMKAIRGAPTQYSECQVFPVERRTLACDAVSEAAWKLNQGLSAACMETYCMFVVDLNFEKKKKKVL